MRHLGELYLLLPSLPKHQTFIHYNLGSSYISSRLIHQHIRCYPSICVTFTCYLIQGLIIGFFHVHHLLPYLILPLPVGRLFVSLICYQSISCYLSLSPVLPVTLSPSKLPYPSLSLSYFLLCVSYPLLVLSGVSLSFTFYTSLSLKCHLIVSIYLSFPSSTAYLVSPIFFLFLFCLFLSVSSYVSLSFRFFINHFVSSLN